MITTVKISAKVMPKTRGDLENLQIGDQVALEGTLRVTKTARALDSEQEVERTVTLQGTLRGHAVTVHLIEVPEDHLLEAFKDQKEQEMFEGAR